MPTSSVGRASRTGLLACPVGPRPGGLSYRAGVTLLELLIVMAILSLMVGVSFPAISSGLETIKLTSAADSLAAFLNGAYNRAERRQQVVALIVDPKANKLELYSNEPGFTRELVMPDGVTIEGDPEPRRVIVMPGGTPPAIAVQIVNRRGNRRVVRVDPMTGFPRIECVSTK